uniref:Origin recognition complex subunit 6 n=1 Tax=Cuerna arida TaxID=1464854 RepID=A0A1B6FT33_9HEMI
MNYVCSEDEMKLLNKLQEKLTLETSEKLTRKGYEYVRLLKLKRGAGLVNMSDTCAMVICLNLAADKLAYTFDKIQAVKLAAVTKKNYASLYHTVEKVLGLDKPVTVSELCVRLACTEVSELAQRLIDRYVRNRDEGLIKCPPIDLSHPMYACAAVLAACKYRKVKVKREQLVDLSRIKAKNLDSLAGELAALAESTERQTSQKRGHHLIDLVEQMVKESQNTSVNTEENKEEEKEEKPKESFAEWKKRMLSKAGNT